MAVYKLFVWNAYHNGDIMLSRPVVRHILDQHDVEITWCCWKNHEILIRDMPVKLMVLPQNDAVAHDMSVYCPADHIPICVWIGHYSDTHDIQWHNCVEVYNRQIRARGLSLEIKSRFVPMFDLPVVDVSVRDRAVFMDNGVARSTQSYFEFDMRALAEAFPDLNFYCAADPRCALSNVIDCSRVNLVVLASISNKCIAIVGKGTGAQTCTFTEANRFKPKALMQFRMPAGVGYWDYPGSRMARFNTREELMHFLAEVRTQHPILLAGGGSSARDDNGRAAANMSGPVLAHICYPQGGGESAASLELLRTALQKLYYNNIDRDALHSLCLQRRRLADQLLETPAEKLESFYRHEAGQTHRLLCASKLAVMPTPIDELPFLKSLEERLHADFAPAVFLAALLYRPPHHWRVSPSAAAVPEWLFEALPCQPLAGSRVQTTSEERTFVGELFAKHLIDPAKAIVLFAGARQDIKTNPHLGNALKGICAARGLQIIAIGQDVDAAVNQRCLEEAGVGGINLCGQLTAGQIAEVIRLCKVAVGVESPWAHIACAVETPNVILMGGGEFGRFMPYSSFTSAVTVPLTCFACNWGCRFARAHCIKDLFPEVIELALTETLDQPSGRPRIYLQHHAFAGVPHETLPWLNPDLLAPMLFEVAYIVPDDAPTFKNMPVSFSGCPLRIVQIARRPVVPAPGARVLGTSPTGSVIVSFGSAAKAK